MTRTLIVTLLLAAPALLTAQERLVNLTGAPVATIREPFTQVTGVREVTPNRAIVTDRPESKIVLADFGTGAVRDIGRKGGGPGEFQMPFTVLAAPGTVTYVADPQANRIHVVSADGRITSAIVVPGDEDGPGLGIPRGIDRSGRLFFQGSPFAPGQREAADSAPVIRWDPASKKLDTLGRVPTGVVGTARASGGNVQMVMRAKPFGGADAWAALPDGRIAIVRAQPYRVDIVDAPTKVRAGRTVSYTPVKVTAAERNAYRERLKSSRPVLITRGGGGGSPPPMPPAPTVADDEFPAVMPAFSGSASVLVSPDGEIWVLRNRAASDKVPTYDIFDVTGRLSGKATLRANSTVVGFGAGTAYVARQDPEDDLVYLEKYRR